MEKKISILIIVSLFWFFIGIFAIMQFLSLNAIYSTWENGEAYINFASFSLLLVAGMFFIFGILFLIAGIKK